MAVERTYGRARLTTDGWVLDQLEPHVTMRLKQIFPRIPKTEPPPYRLANEQSVAADLDWFMQRYPLEMTSAHREELTYGRGLFERNQDELGRIFTADWRPPARAGIRPGEGLRRYQAEAIAVLERSKGLLLADEVGLGKAQPLHASVLTPKGFVALGDLKIGDLVIGADGTSTPITGVYDQGELDCYRVTFSDGSSTECNDEHLWRVSNRNRQRSKRSGEQLPFATSVKTLRRLIDGGLYTTGRAKWFIPMVEAPDLDIGAEHRPIDPYLLGALLGDGCFRGLGVRFSTADTELIARVAGALPPGMLVSRLSEYDWGLVIQRTPKHRNRNPLIQALQELGLWAHSSLEKFVPAGYLLAPREDRLALLQGLMDTDGYAMPLGCGSATAQFFTSSSRLAADVRWLVESLGGTGRTATKIAAGRERFTVTVKLPQPLNPFRIERKASVWGDGHQTLVPRRYIVDAEPIGRKEMRCISVASPDRLYVTDRFIVTHNTVSAAGACLLPFALPAAVVVQPHLQRQWARAIERFTTLSVYGVKHARPYKLPPADVLLFRYSQLAGWYDHLPSLRAKLVAFDEIQELRTGTASDKGRAAKRLVEDAEYVLGLTATPIYNYGDEIHTIMSYIRPEVLGSRAEFLREWCPSGKIKEPQALGTYLREQYAMLRRTKADVGMEMPKVNRIVEAVSYDQSALDSVEKLARALAIKADTGSFIEKGQAARELDVMVRQATGIAKAPYVAKFVQMLVEAGEPVLLAGWHRHCFAAGTAVLMHDGTIKAVENVQIGDRVMGPDGAARNVLSLTRGSGQLYRVSPTKGDPWVCSEGHTLALRVGKNHDRVGAEVKLTAAQFCTLPARQRRNHVLYRAKCLEFENADAVPEPWLVGYWLGDGASRLNDLRIATADQEVVDEASLIARRHGLQLKQYACSNSTRCSFYAFSSGPSSGGWRRNPLLNLFKSLGLHQNKHIPHAYKVAPPAQRRDLLAGLIDSDGHVLGGNGVGTAEFTNTNRRLAEDVAFVARSLGLAAYVKSAVPSSSGYSRRGQTYRVSISGDLTQLPMRIRRKAAVVRRSRKDVLHVGFGLDSAGAGDFFGFEVDGDHLFLLGDFTVVHNCYDIWLDAFRKAGLKPALYTGSESPKQKDETAAAFIRGEINPLIISLRSGAGLDGLQHACSTVVLGELDWSPGIHHQLIGRLDRDGQKDPVTAFFLVADDGSDPPMMEVLGLKASEAHHIVDPTLGLQQAHSDVSHLRTLVERYLERRRKA